MRQRWLIAPSHPDEARQLARQLGVSALLAQCLLNRGQFETGAARTFLEPRLQNLGDPFDLPDMDQAVDRLFAARERQELVVIFGDYDVDGVTSSCILLDAMRALGWSVRIYLPHRLGEGYGLSQEGVANCLEKHPAKVLLAIDCGSNAGDTIAWLHQQGVETIVIDHHVIKSPPEHAVALVNPQRDLVRSGAAGDLCSAGLAFKLVHSLVKAGRQRDDPTCQAYDVRENLDLAALGTIADLVPLTGDNRILVATGLRYLNHTKRPGLAALRKVAGIQQSIGVQETAFQIAPRLNAAGRLEHATEALDLLLAETAHEAGDLASALDHHNRQRQEIERAITEEVQSKLAARFDPHTDYVIVEGKMPWHIGVVGIVAARILRQFYRPTIILGGEGEEWRGSGRSIEGFDLAAALHSCQDLLCRYGGHAMAAGVTIHPDNVPALRDRLNTLAREQIQPVDFQPPLRLDAVIRLKEITVESVLQLEQLAPTGNGNPEAKFVAPHVRMLRPPVTMGKNEQHLKLWITDGIAMHEVVYWNGAHTELPQREFDLAFTPRLNHYNNRTTVQLHWLDWKTSSREHVAASGH